MHYLRFCVALAASLFLSFYSVAADAVIPKVENERACLDTLNILPADLSGSEALMVCAEALRAETRRPKLQFAIGRAFDASNEWEKAEHWYRKAADAGIAGAMTNLGLMYLMGHFVRRDDEQAVQLFRNAAEKGEKISQYYLGRRYWTGSGVSMDRQESIRWLKRSADQGMLYARMQMAHLIYHGFGVPKDKAEGRKALLAVAAELGFEEKISLIAEMASDADAADVLVDLIAAIRNLANAGDRDAQAVLGGIYFNGLGLSADDSEALKWSRLAAEAGNPRAQLTLGLMYRYGDGVFRNSRQAYTWTMKAAQQRYYPAACRLAEMFRDGIGVRASVAQSKIWQASCPGPDFQGGRILLLR